MHITATITDKGQITIPRVIRDQFKGKIVEFIVNEDRIELREVPDVAGSLSAYADGYTPIETVREKTWGEYGRED